MAHPVLPPPISTTKKPLSPMSRPTCGPKARFVPIAAIATTSGSAA